MNIESVILTNDVLKQVQIIHYYKSQITVFFGLFNQCDI